MKHDQKQLLINLLTHNKTMMEEFKDFFQDSTTASKEARDVSILLKIILDDCSLTIKKLNKLKETR
jgi:inosine/xanthosine triphosphate pyrophosphatase family protein